MADANAQQRYLDGLMERIREDRYPSHELLDRAEASFCTSEQVVDYVELLLEKMQESWYPSKDIMNRIQTYTAELQRR